MTGKLTARGVETRSRAKGRYLDGGGLFLRVLEPGRKVYWTYRYRLNGVDREMSVGASPAMSLAEARIRHADLRASVLKGIDPVGDKRKGKAATAAPGGKLIFEEAADRFLDRKELRGELGKNRKHVYQWRATLAKLPAWFRDMPVDQIKPEQVRDVLEPIWTATPETGSRLRGRIEAVIESTRASDDERRNPASWTPWMKTQLGSAKKLGKIDRKTGQRVERGHHAAMHYSKVPAFMARLKEAPGVASSALMFAILCASRTSEVLLATWDEVQVDHTEIVKVDGRNVTVTIPILSIGAERMKMGEPHRVPLSPMALAIIDAMRALRQGDHPYVFPGRPQRPLSNMALAMLLRRLGAADVTTHGFRSSFRNWAIEVEKVEYTVGERCLAHAVGNDAALAYDRSDRLMLRQPVMNAWGLFLSEEHAEIIDLAARRG